MKFNNSILESTIKNNHLVLVDFYADWCAPCQSMMPTLDNLSNDFKGKLKIAKINIDKNPSLSTSFQVMSIPALFYFRDGVLVGKQNGSQTYKSLSNTVKSLMKK